MKCAVLLFTLIFIFLFSKAESRKDGPNPNVLLVIIDDLRPSLGCYGDDLALTPNMDQLASQGVVFTKAYTQQALCAPSRNSMLTSRRPDSTRLYDFYSYWRASAGNYTTLPEYFKSNGYYTQSIGKVFHPGISSNFSDDSPYSWSGKPYHPSTQKYKQAKVCLGEDGKLHKNLVCPVDVAEQPEGTLPDIQSTEYAKQFLRTWNRSKPFFLALGYHKPHVPLKYPAKYLDFFPYSTVGVVPDPKRPKDLPLIAWNPWTDLREREDIQKLNVTFPFGPLPVNYSRWIRQSYYAATTYIDDLLGQVLQTVSDEGYWNNTIIVLTGDHGWSLGEHGEWSKFSNFEVAVRVPLIIRIPNHKNIQFRSISILRNHWRRKYSRYHINHILNTSRYSSAVVELLDLFPTLTELAGLKVPRPCPRYSSNLCTEGKSLVPLLQGYTRNGTPLRNGFAFSQYPRPSLTPRAKPNSDKPRLKHIRYMGYSVRTSRYRYTEWIPFDPFTFSGNWNGTVATELYDHVYDDGEDVNVSGDASYHLIQAKLASFLRRKLQSSLNS